MKFLKENTPYNSNYSYLNHDWNLNYSLEKTSFMNRKLLVEVIIACGYAFGLGYNLFYSRSVLKTGLLFLVLLGVGYLLIIIPHEFSHVICYKSKENVVIRYVLLKLTFISSFNGTISKTRALILLILPFITFTIIPTVASYLLDFNIFLYALASANAIKSGIDLLNFIFIIKNAPKNAILKVDEYDFYFKSKSVDILNSTLNESNNTKIKL